MPLTMLFVHSLTGLSLTSVGAGLTIAGLAALAFMPAAGILIDRFGGRQVLIGACAMPEWDAEAWRRPECSRSTAAPASSSPPRP
ncbi:MFS transporter [Streptomyces boluensis]|uniref:Major facilitator superfamily (MFS) profile domain-containing protein n=1 Tax=Streptomyces boluensis TaxID=1775135 RepID=A0A964UVL5_9ACTN|nr:MFS transporter [Streptomyces boluensis]NBE55048.1 hypothetical protein [Streptomyces boluensis]